MKTQLTTKNGTNVTFEKEGNEIIMKANNAKFTKSDTIGYKGEEKFENVFNGPNGYTRVRLTLDDDNAEKLLTFRKEVDAENKQKDIEKYMPLQKQLPEIDFPEGGNDDEKVRELLEQASNQPHFSGPETDGLNLASESQANKLRKEAHKYCNHETEVSYWRTYTNDARKKIERTVECEKCGLSRKDSASEEVSETARWR